MYNTTFEVLLGLLQPLAQVHQAAEYHPEGDALNHSLQVYDQARAGTQDPMLWAAALLHDVGKAHTQDEHALVGAMLLGEHAHWRVSWLVEHHLDLLFSAREAHQKLFGHPLFGELLLLRRFDLAGRQPDTWVQPPEWALRELLQPGVAECWLSHAAIRKDGHSII